MFKHDLTVALRRFARQRFHTVIGAAVLTLGLVCFVAANLFVGYVRSYDTHWANSERIYVVAERRNPSGFDLTRAFSTRSDAPIAEQLRLDAPELEAVARSHLVQRLVSAGERRSPLMIAYVEPQFTQIFDFSTIFGDGRDVIGEPRSALITPRGAERLFGDVDVVGRSIAIGAQQPVDVTIGGVLAELPNQSHLKFGSLFAEGFDLLVSWDVLETFDRPPVMGWGGGAIGTYVLLPADGSLPVAELDRRLATIAAERVPADASFLNIGLEARPVTAITQMAAQSQFQGYYGGREWVDIFAALRVAATAILAIACLNFVNLAFAQATSRALDVGTRKVLGATTRHIIGQDLLQTALVVLIALTLALPAVAALAELFTPQWSPTLQLPWREPGFIVFLGGTLLGVTVAAGLYPAFVLSRARRASASRIGTASDALVRLRTALVGLQFGTASALVVAAIVLLMQRSELHDALIGRFGDQYVGVFLDQSRPPDPDVIATELMRGPGIKGTTATNGVAFATQARRFRRSPDDTSAGVQVDFVYTGHDYFEAMQVPLVAGRAFARDRADDLLPTSNEQWAARQGRGASIVLDRAAARALGWPEPTAALGQAIYAPGNARYVIIGITERTPTSIRATGASGVSYVYAPAISHFRIVRIASDRIDAALAHIDEVVKSLSPGRPSYRQFFDQLFEGAYWTFELTNRVLTGLAVFALLISSIGLFGMAGYLADRRTREIGIRKVQGATPASILRLLLWDFSKPVVWANLVAWPVALIAIDRYLGLFAERVAITPLPFALALIATWLLACLAVGGCVWHAARLHPAEALRSE
jgi:putative ABC transport system permease protein